MATRRRIPTRTRRPAHQEADPPLGIGAWITLTVCAALAVFVRVGLRDAFQLGERLRRLVEVPATIERVWTTEDVRHRAGKRYTVHASYRVEWQGEQRLLEGIRIQPVSGLRHDELQPWFDRFPPGAEVVAHVDPEAPSRSVLLHEATFAYHGGSVLLLELVLLLAVGVTGARPWPARIAGCLVAILLAIVSVDFFTIPARLDLGAAFWVVQVLVLAFLPVFFVMSRTARIAGTGHPEAAGPGPAATAGAGSTALTR